MHCIFAGARNVFLNSLIHDTCADVSVYELGILGINGSEEAVVLAQSRIQQFVQLFETNLSLPNIRESAVKKQFKCFVETHADKYTMDLLLLPSSLKEELLNLTRCTMVLEPEEHCDLPDFEIIHHNGHQTPSMKNEDQPCLDEVRSKASTPVSELTKQMDTVLSESAKKNVSSLNGMLPIQESCVSKERQSCKRRCSDVEERCTKKQFSLDNPRESFGTVTVVDVDDLLSDSCSDLDDSVIFVKDYDVSEEAEYKILVNFFQTMGYDKEIVEIVIGELGQSEEPLKLLDEIEKEHKRVHEEQARSSCNPGSSNVLRDISANKMNVSKTLEELSTLNCEKSKKSQPNYPTEKTQKSVNQVTDCQAVKPKISKRTFRTAANFSFNTTSTKINPLSQVKSDDLDGSSGPNFFSRELVKKDLLKDTEFIARGTSNLPLQNTVLAKDTNLKNQSPVLADQNSGFISSTQPSYNLKAPQTECPPRITPKQPVECQKSNVGPGNHTLETKMFGSSDVASQRFSLAAPVENIERQNPIGPAGPGSPRCLEAAPVANIMKANNPDLLGRYRFFPPEPNVNAQQSFLGRQQVFVPAHTVNVEGPKHTDPSVTGSQRFFNTINVPYKLELQNEPGKADLKHIIIDGSNIAMSHGLKQYFSCRGIALAVEYFWKQGHRNITVFVPQWRTRRNPNNTEQHFLQQLQDLGILSLTPARMVLGSRIASHDDRFLLHLSEKTGGVIVTNDNLREFVTESPSWAQIIKERILQYTFAGDIFMVPDDPLGKHGPNLHDFLHQKPPIQQRNFLQPLCHPIEFRHPWLQHQQLQQPRFQQQRFSNVPALCLPTNTKGLKVSEPSLIPPASSAAGVAIQPELQVHRGPPLCGTPQIQKVQSCQTKPTQRNSAETMHLKIELLNIFPENQQRHKIDEILTAHPYMRDLNALSAMVLD
ncbi:NEDD4-binding protein 1 isoform X2 [Lissotriton helveticus]